MPIDVKACLLQRMPGICDMSAGCIAEKGKMHQNRCADSGGASYEYSFPRDGYDVTLDTHVSGPDVCARRIMEALRIGDGPWKT